MDFEKALVNPTAVFKEPRQVILNKELSREQKVEILRRWEYDARLLEVAEEESMSGPQPVRLQEIRHALHTLGFYPDPDRSGTTKTGGR